MGLRRSRKPHITEVKQPSAHPVSERVPASTTQADLPEELIAARAYEKWQLRGCPMGQDGAQDWYAARAELEAERLGWAAPQAGDDKRSASR